MTLNLKLPKQKSSQMYTDMISMLNYQPSNIHNNLIIILQECNNSPNPWFGFVRLFPFIWAVWPFEKQRTYTLCCPWTQHTEAKRPLTVLCTQLHILSIKAAHKASNRFSFIRKYLIFQLLYQTRGVSLDDHFNQAKMFLALVCFCIA